MMVSEDPQALLSSLTERQREVLRLVCQGFAYKEIGEELYIAESTIKAHMGNIYLRLGLDVLPPPQRTKILFEIYCPLLEGIPEEMVSIEEDPEPVAAEIEAMVTADESALVVYRQQPLKPIRSSTVPGSEDGPRRRGIGLFGVLLVGLVIGAALLGVVFFALGGSFGGTEQPEVPTQEASIPTEATPTQPLPSATTEPATATTEAPTATLEPSPTTAPSETPVQDTDSGSVLEVGEWWQQDGVWLRLKRYEFGDVFPSVRVFLEFWNQTGETLLFSWNTSGNLTLRDNTGHVYPLTTQFEGGGDNEVVPAGELVEITNGQFGQTAIFQDEYLFNSNVTELILEVIAFSRVDQAQFRIPLGK